MPMRIDETRHEHKSFAVDNLSSVCNLRLLITYVCNDVAFHMKKTANNRLCIVHRYEQAVFN
ncbi:hypothetical protein D3C84_1028720 [compost metagenome]